MTEMVLLQILHMANDPRFLEEEKRVSEIVNKNRAMLGGLWKNFTTTKTALAKATEGSKDIRLRALDANELNRILNEY